MQATTIRFTRAALVVALIALGGCTAQFRNHGYVPPDDALAQIAVGIDSRASVEDTIGVPTTSGMLDDHGYYYVRSRVRTYAWKAPEVVDRQIVAISFDDAGVVSNITHYGLKDGRIVPLSRRITRSGDGEISFIRKLFGNIVRLSAADLLNN